MGSGKQASPRVMVVGSRSDQVYSYEDETGRQFHWSVTAALAFAQAKNERYTISLHDLGVTLPLVRASTPSCTVMSPYPGAVRSTTYRSLRGAVPTAAVSESQVPSREVVTP